jgi:hypothetical protein
VKFIGQQNKQMQITIKIPEQAVAQLINGIMQNYPESGAGSVLQCTHWKYSQNVYEFEDEVEGKLLTLTARELMAAVPLMFTDKWPKGCTKLPTVFTEESVEEWLCQADATDHDAFVQLAIFGEVIYG